MSSIRIDGDLWKVRACLIWCFFVCVVRRIMYFSLFVAVTTSYETLYLYSTEEEIRETRLQY